MRHRLVAAVVASIFVVLSTPYVGQARAALQGTFPDQYRAIIAGTIFLAAAAAVVAAIVRIRDRHVPRYGALLAALAIAITYAVVMRTGESSRDLVERFHFVEYGLLTCLYYAAWSRRPDACALVLPACAAIVVGIVDEWFQWFVPTRVGELSDVLLNTVAVGCGLLVGVALRPPVSTAWTAVAARAALPATAVVVVCSALFVDAVHLGYAISDPDVGTFTSTFSRVDLHRAGADRAERWRHHAPVIEPGLAREDHYLSEAQWHLQRRNEHRNTGDLRAAWAENSILERFFAPVLQLAMPGAQWSHEDRAVLAAAAHAAPHYVSDAAPYPIFEMSRALFWGVTAAAVGILLLLVPRPAMRATPAPL